MSGHAEIKTTHIVDRIHGMVVVVGVVELIGVVGDVGVVGVVSLEEKAKRHGKKVEKNVKLDQLSW